MSERTDAARQGTDQTAPAWPGLRRLLALAPRLLALVLAGVLAAVVMVNWNRWVGGAGPQWTDDAALAADLTPLSAQVGGRISAVPATDFQPVHAGDVLARIDDAPFRAQVAQAEAAVAGAEAAIANLQAQERLQAANIAAAQAQLEGARATAVRYRLEAERQNRLLATRIAGTEQAVEQADAAAKLADAQVMQASANAEAAQRQLDVQHSQEAQLAANLKAAQAALELARINLGYTVIASPVDGLVGQRRVYPGQYVGIGTQVIAVVPLRHVYVIADYKETQLTHLALGQPAEVRIDTFPGVVLHGHVASWSPAHRVAVRAAAARQRDRQLHQGGAAHSGQDRARRRWRPGRAAAPRHVGRGDDPDRRGGQSRQRTGDRTVSATMARLAPHAHHIAPAAPLCTRPIVGIAAVLLGSVISTLFSRITTFGLADLRGAVHAGFDEGAWITTAATVGQMCIGPVAAWLGLVFGPRRVLMVSASVFAVASALIPNAPDLASVLVGQAVAGLASGTFIPLTIGFVLQSLRPALWPYGIAAYGLNLELSLNVPAALEGWYIEHLSWHWIFWQGTLLALPMLAAILLRHAAPAGASRGAARRRLLGNVLRRRRVLHAACRRSIRAIVSTG